MLDRAYIIYANSPPFFYHFIEETLTLQIELESAHIKIEELKETLEDSLGAADLVESLTNKNFQLNEVKYNNNNLLKKTLSL